MIPDHHTPVIGGVNGARRHRESGFALLITITLLAFLVLLLVSLASLTRVETQVASNNQQISQARQNALMALNIALGQLQKFTGPDQRTTARADMDAALANTTTANGRWLAAYGNGAPVDTTYALKPSQIPATLTGANADSKGSQAKLLNWLVSGNEGTAFDPSSAATVGTDGHIVAAPASITYTPASAINLATASATPATAETQALLVGANSATAQSDYVAAPLVEVKATAPGLTTAERIGRYAWWVGDEGAKARVNLPMASAAQTPQAFVSAQRVAIELMDGQNPVGSTNGTDLIGTAAYDSSSETLLNLVSPKQLSMLTPTAATTLPAALKVRFHDLSASSTTVLADAYAGGLKKDLSAILSPDYTDSTYSGSPLHTDTLFVPDDIIAPATYHFAVPTWGQLRSFAQTMTTSAALDPRLPTSTQTGIAPVLTYAALGMQYTAPMGDGLNSPIRLAMYPLAVLWNPYTTPIKAAKYELGFTRRFNGKLQLQVNKAGTTYPWTVKETLDFGRGGAAMTMTAANMNPDGSADPANTAQGGYMAGSNPANTYIRFVIDVEQDIPAGQSLIFTLRGSESGRDYEAPHTNKPTNVMTNGLNMNGHVLLNRGATIGPGESGRDFRVAVYGVYNAANNSMRNMFHPANAATHMSGGGGDAYLGQVVSAGPVGYLSSATNDKKWYQSLSGCTMSGDGSGNQTGSGNPGGLRNAFLQTAGPLTPATLPTSVMSLNRMFSVPTVNTFTFPDVRWIAQSNPRAAYTTRPLVDRSSNPLNMIGGGGMDTIWQDFTADSTDKRASSGLGLDAGTTVTDTTLFEFRSATQPLMSIGQLQHADMSLISGYPSYAIGNSLADAHFKDMREQVRRAVAYDSGQDSNPYDQTTNYYDISWLLNRVLWDRYFVSTVPHPRTGTAADSVVTAATGVDDLLPNPRHVKYGTAAPVDLHDAGKAAANLLLKGGFNINSTSEQAWRAVLGGINQLEYDPEGDGTSGKLKAALPRFSKPTVSTDAWKGYRALTEEQIAELAKYIVTEIRNRGPFVSLADFVNRRLVDSTAAASLIDERLKGVIQAAIDATVAGMATTNTAVAPFNDTPAYTSGATYLDAELMRGGTTSTAPYSSRSAFAPQFLTQADVLSAIGAGLSARSDTFTIRTYGEAVNPVTQDIQGRAWCEAVVQRLPEYMNDATTSSAAGDPAITAPTSLQNPDNKKFGRRYKIISFRWLSSNDI